jgi:hypothetical protein
MRTIFLASMIAATCVAQTLPEGSKVRVRLEQPISSATADEGQVVELSVADDVVVDGHVLVPTGTRVQGTVVQAQAKRRMGRAGKLDFSVDKIVMRDGNTIPLRYSVNKHSGESRAVSTGIITAGVALVAWPVAPLVLLRHGKDVTINQGMSFEVFTDHAFPPAEAARAAISIH